MRWLQQYQVETEPTEPGTEVGSATIEEQFRADVAKETSTEEVSAPAAEEVKQVKAPAVEEVKQKEKVTAEVIVSPAVEVITTISSEETEPTQPGTEVVSATIEEQFKADVAKETSTGDVSAPAAEEV